MNSPIRILYVDDSSTDRELVCCALNAEPGAFHVTEADSHRQLEPLLARGGFELVLSDLRIPDFETFDVFDAVRAKDPQMVLIVEADLISREGTRSKD